ncbi:hypothetical protein G7017_03950 [Pseudomonas fulva]|nr:hypothetical protein [Pseudomonas fulva]MBA1220057.1 hypothetical protein [Pseudomonas fulva]
MQIPEHHAPAFHVFPLPYQHISAPGVVGFEHWGQTRALKVLLSSEVTTHHTDNHVQIERF